MSKDTVATRLRALETWAQVNMRDFPWRRSADPWEVLVAEVLLRRTRASQVASIHQTVIQALPSPAVTARKSVAAIRRLVASAGLLSRAEQISELAKAIVDRHGGLTPTTVDALLQLPGVGPYVAGAVAASVGSSVVLIDANTVRVATRVAGLDPGPGDVRRRKDVVQAVQDLFGGPVDRDTWWATLDLAALVCTARTPSCDLCPLESGCTFAGSHPAR